MDRPYAVSLTFDAVLSLDEIEMLKSMDGKSKTEFLINHADKETFGTSYGNYLYANCKDDENVVDFGTVILEF